MTVFKIVGMIGILLAIVAAFVSVPFAAPALAICGAVVGWATTADNYVRVIVSAVALHLLAGAFDGIPAVGPYLSTIIANLGSVLAGAAILIILRNIYNRIRT